MSKLLAWMTSRMISKTQTKIEETKLMRRVSQYSGNAKTMKIASNHKIQVGEFNLESTSMRLLSQSDSAGIVVYQDLNQEDV